MNENTIKGIYRAPASRGFGFVSPLEHSKKGSKDIFVKTENSMGAFHGDIVNVTLEGKILEIVEHSIKTVIGTLKKDKSGLYVVPDDPKLKFEVIAEKSNITAAPGMKVEIELTKYPSENNPSPYGKLTRVFGDTVTLESNYNSILYENNIKLEFDPAAAEQAKSLEHAELIPIGRLDLRNKIIFTIDGEDAKDLDDAISIEKTESGYLLGVHIADVAEYVAAGSPLDFEAFERGTSVYFADQVVPMLPPEISNGICSLTSGHDCYALSAFISLSEDGDIIECNISESIISTAVRGVYSELNDILQNNGNSQYYNKYLSIIETLNLAVELYKILAAKSLARGMIEFDTVEAKIIIDENNNVTDIVKLQRGTTERLIEQFMLCANEAVANWLYWQSMPCIYRTHENPWPEKIRAFSIFAHNLGLDITPLRAKNIYSSCFQKLLSQAYERDLSTVVSLVLLRSFMKAKYSAVAAPHFGLAIDMYCHFTSPIRRYPDLIIHRIIKAVLHGDIDAMEQLAAFTETAAKQSTDTEVQAVIAEREIEDLYKTAYMSGKVGEIFEGIISSVTSFGFFVELENTCEGLIPISSLDGYFEFDENSLRLYCGRKSYNLGDKVEVVIEKTNIITRRIDMRLADI
ncbi:MAG: ribonuclease R [Oscillospiraceae bacterium]|nr:ribonuclease R [Oscillospiraceae bacterium]